MTAPAVFTEPLPPVLARLRAAMAADGWTAESPLTLDSEADLIARLERQDR